MKGKLWVRTVYIAIHYICMVSCQCEFSVTFQGVRTRLKHLSHSMHLKGLCAEWILCWLVIIELLNTLHTFTFVRLLSNADSPMFQKASMLRKGFTERIVSVRLLPIMNFLMIYKFWVWTIALATKATFKWCVSSVVSLMPGKVCKLGRSFATLIPFASFLQRMNSLVNSKAWALFKSLIVLAI